jgi:predicted nucleic acid-binding protein
LDDVDDVVLITLPISGIRKVVEEWKESRRKIDLYGPEKLLDLEVRKKIFLAVLSKLPRSLNINGEEYWEKVWG